MKKIALFILLIIFFVSGIFMFKSNSNQKNVIKNLTFNQIEDNKAPLNYKKEYTFIIKELSGKDNVLEFNIINHYVEVYIDDNLVYKLKKEKIKKDTLVKVPLTKKDINQKVKIVLIPTRKEIDNDLDLKIK